MVNDGSIPLFVQIMLAKTVAPLTEFECSGIQKATNFFHKSFLDSLINGVTVSNTPCILRPKYEQQSERVFT